MSRTKSNANSTPVEHMVVVRESEMYDQMLMQGMIETTLHRANGVPGASEMLSEGMGPINHPARYNAHVLPGVGRRTVVFERDGTVFYYSMASAATVEADSKENLFIAQLIKLVAKYRPRHLWAAEVSRFARNFRYSGEIYQAFSDHVDEVHAEINLDMRQETSALVWGNLTAAAAMERNNIVRRTLIGRLHSHRRGEWVVAAVPPGYKKVNKRLELDESQIEVVQAGIPIVFDEALTPAQKCERLGAIGLTRDRLKSVHGEDADFSDLRVPSAAIKALERWAGLWETGAYTHRWKNQIPNLDSLVGYAIHAPETKDEQIDYPDGYFLLPYEVPLPDGGWAPAELFNKVHEASRLKPKVGGVSHKKTKPLLNVFVWTDSDHEKEYENRIFSKHNWYDWYRRPIDSGESKLYGRWDGWRRKDADRGEVRMASLDAVELQRSIADGIAEAIKHGVPAELLASDPSMSLGEDWSLPVYNSATAKRQALERHLAEEQRLCESARRNANKAKTEELADEFVADAERYASEVARLRGELEALDDAPTEITLAQRVETLGGIVVAVLAKLAQLGLLASRDLRSALDVLLRDATLRLVEDGSKVEWSLYVHVPTPEGAMRLGPVVGRVPNRKRRAKIPRLDLDMPLNRQARIVLERHPHQDLVSGLAAHLSESATTDPELAPFFDHLRAVYSDAGFDRRAGWGWHDSGKRQAILDIVLAAGGEMSSTALAEALENAGLNRKIYQKLSREGGWGRGHPRILERTGDWVSGSTRRPRGIKLIACPHCGGWASHVNAVPEVPTNVLCPTCRRMPTPNSPVFPECYVVS